MRRNDYHRLNWRAFALSTWLFFMAGCPPPSEVRCGTGAGAETGTYNATLDEVYSADVTDVLYSAQFGESGTTCAGLDGLGVGTVLPLAIGATKENVGCGVTTADVTLPSSVQVGDTSAAHLSVGYASTFALFHKNVSVGSCAGEMEILLRAPGGRPSDPKMAGQLPPVLVSRIFLTQDAAICPALGGSGAVTCSDIWVGTLGAR